MNLWRYYDLNAVKYMQVVGIAWLYLFLWGFFCLFFFCSCSPILYILYITIHSCCHLRTISSSHLNLNGWQRHVFSVAIFPCLVFAWDAHTFTHRGNFITSALIYCICAWRKQETHMVKRRTCETPHRKQPKLCHLQYVIWRCGLII